MMPRFFFMEFCKYCRLLNKCLRHGCKIIKICKICIFYACFSFIFLTLATLVKTHTISSGVLFFKRIILFLVCTIFCSCDGCHQCPISGPRYKCQECQDFDYCETCFHNKKEHNHTFSKLRDIGVYSIL